MLVPGGSKVPTAAGYGVTVRATVRMGCVDRRAPGPNAGSHSRTDVNDLRQRQVVFGLRGVAR